MIKHVIDCYGRDIHFPAPKPVAYKVATDGDYTYVCYSSQDPCAIMRIDSSDGVTLTWAYGAWADRATLTYIPIDQTRDIP